MSVITFRDAALDDVRHAFEWYESKRARLGRQFAQELVRTLRDIAASPTTYRQIRKNVRKCNLHRFPYAVFYRIESGRIVVAGVIDLRSDPRRWDRRF